MFKQSLFYYGTLEYKFRINKINELNISNTKIKKDTKNPRNILELNDISRFYQYIYYG